MPIDPSRAGKMQEYRPTKFLALKNLATYLPRTMDERSRYRGVTASPELQAQVTEVVRTLGDAEASRRLGISRVALLRLLAGMPVRAGTLALAREGLSR
jgi:hypothetical protein